MTGAVPPALPGLRILLACQAVPGHLNPYLALAAALRARGHFPAIYSGELARAAVEREGIPFFPFEESMDRLLSSIVLPKEGSSDASRMAVDGSALRNIGKLNATMIDWLLATVPQQVKDLTAAAESFQAGMLVSDPTLLGPPLILRHRLKIPCAVFSVLAAYSLQGKDDPPWGRGLPPPRDPLTRLSYRIQRQISDWVLTGFRAYANRLRTDHGLPPLEGRVADEVARMPLFIVPSAPSFDYPRTDLPATVHYVGACVWDGGKAPDVPAWLTELPAGQPVVHVTEGTIFTRSPIVLSAAAQGLGGLPMHVIMTSGKHRKPEELDLGGPLQSNIRVEQFVSHRHLFEKTDLVVTTGGAGTMLTALAAGIPVIAVPGAWELAENAERLKQCGAGLRVNPQDCNPQSLRAAVERVLGNPSFRETARRIAAELKSLGGPVRASELLESLAARHAVS